MHACVCMRVCVCACVRACVWGGGVSDFGFSQSSFSGIERRESYNVPVKFFSGGITTGFFFNLTLTASKYDVHLNAISVYLL